MRRSIFKKGHDICFFCTLRLEAASELSTHRTPRQARYYRSTIPSWRPAGTATARREDYDDSSATAQAVASAGRPSTEPSWRCKCGHYNQPRRSDCTLCSIPRPTGARFEPKSVQPSVLAPHQASPIPKAEVRSSPFGLARAPTGSLPSRLSSTSGSRGGSAGPTAASDLPAPGLSRFRQGVERNRPRREGQPASNSYNVPSPVTYEPMQASHLSSRRATSGDVVNQPEYPSPRRIDSLPYREQYQRQPQTQSRMDGTGQYRSQQRRPTGPRNSILGDLDRSTQATESSFRIHNSHALRQAAEQRQDEPSTPISARRPTGADGIDFRSGFRDRSGGEGGPVGRRTPRSDRFEQRPWTGRLDSGGRGSGQPVQAPLTPQEDQMPDALSLAFAGEGDLDENERFGSLRRRKGNKLNDRQISRRSKRFELEETPDSIGHSDGKRRDRQTRRIRHGNVRSTAFDLEMADLDDYSNLGAQSRIKKPKVKKQTSPRIELPQFISVENLAKSLKIKLEKFVDELEEEGFEGARYDHVLDAQTSFMFAEMHGFEPVLLEPDVREDIVARPPPEDLSVFPPRPPIVTIMGHVDHGKTTILDWLRKSSVVASEHGGITQHIGAFSVTMPGTHRTITFLDTPGHAAFLDMRRRGANVTDIVVLVVAADDSVKPQTIEAIKHAKEASVHMIVAINKVDKEDADIERVKQDLSAQDVIVEDYGGDIQAIPLSGKTGFGMEALEEAIITLADVSDFRAEIDGPVEGAIIESKVTAAGRVATILVRRGTLRTGDFIVAGNTWARVRTLRNDAGQLVEEALPGTPVQVDGWRGEDPTAGLEVLQANTEEHAKDVVALRSSRMESVRTAAEIAAMNAVKSADAEARAKVLAWEKEQGWGLGKVRAGRPWDNAGWVEPAEDAGPKKVHFVVKADVAGSVEAIVAAVAAIGNKEVSTNIVHSGTGQLGESDIRLLASTGEVSYAINFNQTVENSIHRLAEAAGVQILDHNIIYKVTDQVKEKLGDELAPIITQKVLGEAEISQIFDITVKKQKVKVAGCKVTNGLINKSEKIRVLRNNETIFTGKLDSLKNVKKDVTEMRKGSECGMSFESWDDFQEGDKVQCLEEISEKRKLY